MRPVLKVAQGALDTSTLLTVENPTLLEEEETVNP